MAKVILYKKIRVLIAIVLSTSLKNKGVEFDIIDLTDKPEEIDRIKEETGWRTVPIILINGKLVGGYTDLKALEEEGKLDELLNN